MTNDLEKKRVTVPSILKRKASSEKISALTAYDFTFAHLLDQAGIDIILVGDSLSCVVQGNETTLPVTLDEMIYHCRCVSRGVRRALVVGDMPFMSYQQSPEKALESAGRLLKEGAVSAVKLEGGIHLAETINRLVQIDIPVMGHIGLTPQSYHRMGGNKLQGKHSGAQAGSKERLVEDALAVQEAGAFSVVLEGVPYELALEITNLLSIPVIGIGAGSCCDGQILVVNDMLGLTPDFKPRFVKHFAHLGTQIESAVKCYVDEIQSGAFPADEHTFKQEKVKKDQDSKSAKLFQFGR